MSPMPTEDDVIQKLDPPPLIHSHRARENLPWWRWRVLWDSEIRRFWVRRWVYIDVPCTGALEPTSPVRVEKERTWKGIKIVASRQFDCSYHGHTIMYAAMLNAD